MRITVSDILEEGQDILVTEPVTLDSAALRAVPVEAKLHVMKDGQTVYVRGHIHAEVEQECSRCLAAAMSVLDFDFSAGLEPKRKDTEETYELSGMDLDLGFYENDEIDLTDLIREQVTINIPIKPLCTESCKGICPRCGANRNRDECTCEGIDIDDRWKILNTLFSERKA
ncbi:MAG: YceD family protein [Thermodesulfovibrionales bacterium]